MINNSLPMLNPVTYNKVVDFPPLPSSTSIIPPSPLFPESSASVLEIKPQDFNVVPLVTVGLSLASANQLKALLSHLAVNKKFEGKHVFKIIFDKDTKKDVLKVFELCVVALKGITVVIPNPVVRKGIQATFDASAYAISAYKINQPQEESKPHNWKNTAHKIAQVSLSTVGLVGSLFVVTSSLDLIDEENSVYKTATNALFISVALEVAYTVFQQIGIFAKQG